MTGRGRIAGLQSVALRIARPAMEALRRAAPRRELVEAEAEPEQALAIGDVALVLGDVWQHQAWRLPAGVVRDALLFDDPDHLVLPARHPAARRHREAVPLAELAGEAWSTGHAGTGWDVGAPGRPHAARDRRRAGAADDLRRDARPRRGAAIDAGAVGRGARRGVGAGAAGQAGERGSEQTTRIPPTRPSRALT